MTFMNDRARMSSSARLDASKQGEESLLSASRSSPPLGKLLLSACAARKLGEIASMRTCKSQDWLAEMFYTNGLTLHRRRTLENGFHGAQTTRIPGRGQ